MTKKKLRTGDQVKFTDKHVWSGSTGHVIRYELTPWGQKPVVKLDGIEREVFIINSHHAVKI